MTRPADETQLQAIRAAWRRYVVVLAGLGAIVLIVTFITWPWPYDIAVEQLILPQYESRFGFQGGRLSVSTDHDSYTLYGVLTVRPGGVLDRAGVKAGDIPVEYHGGLWAFYGALQRFESGERGRFEVLAQSDWREWSKRRTIDLVPQQAGR